MGTQLCAYFDPPYNTGNEDFPYKDGYRHSSWMSLMAQVSERTRHILSEDGMMWCTLDSTESPRFWLLAEKLFSEENFVGHIAWQHSVQSKGYTGKLAVSHNNVFGFARSSDFELGVLPRTEEHNKAYSNPDGDPKGPWREGYLVNSLYRPNLIYEVETPSGNIIEPPENGWRYSKETMQKKIEAGEIIFSDDETRLIRKIYLKDQDGHVPTSVWLGDEAGTSRSANRLLKSIVPDQEFPTAKPPKLIERLARISAGPNKRILDCFGGSGTTAQSIIDLNREEDDHWSYILIEIGEYFDTVMMPRIQKVVFAEDWNNGVPQFDDGETGGVSHMFKYHRLESYEDTLNNIRLDAPDVDQEQLPDDYMLGYMLDVESRGSKTLLRRDAFEKPFDYKLDIQRGDVSPQPTTVDLQETFHYLIGMRVESMEVHEHQDREYRVTRGQVPGPDGLESAVVVWRDLYLDDPSADGNEPDIDWHKEKKWARDELFDEPVDRIYANGPSGITGYDRIEYVFKEEMDPAYGGEA